MAPHLRIANTGVVHREIGDWTNTETAKDITRSLEVVRAKEGPGLTMIAGSPGIGKTLSVKRFCDELDQRAIYIQAACGEGTVWNLAKYMERLWGQYKLFNSVAEARMKFASMIGAGTLVVIDEAQYLNQKNRKTGQRGEAFEWLRAMAEEGDFDLVFVGDLSLRCAIREMPQLQSRMVRPIIIPHVPRADVLAILDGSPFDEPVIIDTLHDVAKREGGLRNVENVVRTALLFAGRDIPTVLHVRAAITDLKLDKKMNQKKVLK